MKKDIYMILNPYPISLRLLTWTIFSFLAVIGGFAQGITETRWYFGDSPQNLIFDLNGRDVMLQDDQFTPFGTAGAATITDQFTGNLLFYTDGVNVYDVSHTLVPNGAGLAGNPAINVPVVASPLVGSPGQYYLITNSGNTGANEIQYSIVDSGTPGNGTVQFPYGDVTQQNNATGLVDPSEGMILIPEGDGNLFWLITQNRNSFDFRVSRIDSAGIALDSTYSDFVGGGTPGFEASHFAFNRDSSLLAVAPKTANRNLWLMGFDPANGVLTLDSVVTGTGFNDGANESIYDVEWSANGQKLYLSRFGGTGTVGQLYQMDFVDSTTTGRIEPVLSTPVFRSYGLKRAIDNRIYHLYQEQNAGSPFSLGRVNAPNQVADSVVYQATAFGDDFNGRQFPEFTPGYDFVFDTFDFHWIDSCETNVTKFFPIVDPVPNSLTWDLGEDTSDEWIPNFMYSGQGSYQVELTAEVAGIRKTVQQTVNILTNDLMVDLGMDTTICIDEVLTLDAGPGVSFVWNTGETTQTIEVDTTDTYWVEVTNATGCTGFDEIFVLEYGVEERINNQWYFGERAGIDFNGGAIAILDGNNQQADEGCATISDVNGELLFYTNGVTVWNREHEVMENGENVGGDLLSAQNSLIMPFAGDQTLFYLFTTEEVYGDDEYVLKYSIVDMKEDGSLGKVIVKNVKLMENSTERITGSDFTGNDFIIAHEFGNNMFRTHSTSANGLSGAIYSPAGEVHEFMDELSATGYMKLSRDFNQIAVLLPGTGQVEILDFNRGEISNPRLIETGEDDLYGLEFLGNRLFLTTSSANSKLIHYDLDSLNSDDPVSDIEATKFDGYSGGSNYGALQLGPDGTVYMAVDNSGDIGTITASMDGDDGMSNFDPEGFSLQGRISRLGLPNFRQIENTPNQEPRITVTPGCVGQESTFEATGRDPNNSIENYLWIFGDGFSLPFQDTTHVYQEAGTYTVQMILSNRCDTDTILSTTIVIENLPVSPAVPTDTAICDQPIVLSAWPVDNPDFTYQWSTGETTREITVANPAFIDITITDINTGCPSETATVVVGDARPAVDLGADRIYCQGDPEEILDSQIENASTYEWFIDGVLSGSNRTLQASTTNAGIFEYIIRVENIFGCINSDTLLVSVLGAPDISFVGNSTSDCDRGDGYIELTFNTAGSFSYEISGTENQGPFNFDGPGTITIPTGSPADSLSPGNYNLMVTNLVSGCVRNEVVQIEDPGNLGLSATAAPACIGDGAIDINFTMAPATFDLVIDYEDGTNVLNANLTSPPPSPVLQNLDTGTYFITVTDTSPGLGCVETAQVRIPLLNPQPDFTFNTPQQICGTQGEIFVFDEEAGAATYTWNGPGISNVTGDTITVTQPGTYTVTAVDDGTLFCPRTEEIEVIFNNLILGAIRMDGDPCEGMIDLSLSTQEIVGGSGNYIFNWSNGSQAPQTTVTSSGTYSVTVTDQVTGCEETVSVDITVEEEFEVEITLEPDCDTGQVSVIATTNVFDPSVTYQWEDGNGNILADTDSILTVGTSGTYQVTATNASGACMVMDAADVAVVPINPEDLILPERATFCREDVDNPTASLDPGIFNTYEWRLLPDDAILSTDQVFEASVAGTYEVTLFNGFTCTTDQVLVVEDCRPIIFAPNAFTPGRMDGRNDTFSVFPNDFVDNFEILIYTRWGELVFRSENQDFQWDGVYRGQLLPPGTYAYVMKFSSSLNPTLGTIEQFGSVTLIR